MSDPEAPTGKPRAAATARIDLASLPVDVAEALQHFDADGDGFISTTELFRGGLDAQSDKRKVRRGVATH
jgi:hypothetical protein